MHACMRNFFCEAVEILHVYKLSRLRLNCQRNATLTQRRRISSALTSGLSTSIPLMHHIAFLFDWIISCSKPLIVILYVLTENRTELLM
jgi:hypothetical protein